MPPPSMTCRVLHQIGKATATTSAPAGTCSDNAATAIQPAINNAAAFSQAVHRVGVVFPRSIERIVGARS